MKENKDWLDLEEEISRKRKEEERVERREMILNIAAIVVLLAVFIWTWNYWGKSGFQNGYRQISQFATSETARSEKQSANKQTEGKNGSQAGKTSIAEKKETPTFSEITAAIGQSGDSYGGANALFSSLVAAFAAWAGYLQFRALRKAQRAYQNQLDENRREKFARKKEAEERKSERFEAQFFQLLRLSQEARDRITTIRTGPSKEPKSGSAALDAFANSLYHGVTASSARTPISARQLTYHYQKIYNRRPSALGPYFRLLFQTFKFISESTVTESLKMQCAKIARGQMSDGSILLLALNGMTIAGYDFVRYIEEFGLLEHMLKKYSTEFGPFLREAYRPRAFLGSGQRALVENLHETEANFEATKYHWADSQLKDRDALYEHSYIGVGNDAQE